MIGGRKIAALCISRVNDDASHETIISLGSALSKINCSLFVYCTSTDLYWDSPGAKGDSAVFRLADPEVLDALIIFSERIRNVPSVSELEKRAVQRGIPVISIGSSEGCDYCCHDVEFDYEAGFENVVRHVIEVHKPCTVHFMAGIKDNDFSEKRLAVFRRIIGETDIPFGDEDISYGQFWSLPAMEATEKLIKENRLPDAIICANDIMAIAVCNVLKNHGIKCPEEIIVTGFDGVLEIDFSVPKITSCRCCYSDIADKCAELIQNLWEGREMPRKNYILPKLLLSESCGCDFSEKVNTSEYLSRINNNFFRFREEDRILAEITARMQTCRTVEEAAKVLHSYVIYDMCCILTLECIDESINPLTSPEKESYGETMCLFYNADRPEDPPRKFSVRDIIPDLETQLRVGYPLVFAALSFLDVQLGYVCFHFHDNDIANYTKVPQTVNALNNAIGGFRNIRWQQHLGRQLEDMYRIDSLTGLNNRRGFAREYKRLLSGKKENDRFTVVLSDLDGLKQINDRFGHGEGDRSIRIAAEALRKACPDNAIFVRFGGDEMLAVIPEAVSEENIRKAAKEFLDSVNSSSDKPYKVSSSLGIYVTEKGDSLDFEELFKKSDALMYADKKRKKEAESKNDK